MLLSCAIAGLTASAALAQAANYMSVEATAGKPLQLSYHASAHKSDCTPAPLATFDVLQAPKLGVLTVRNGMLTTNKVAGCRGSKFRPRWCSIGGGRPPPVLTMLSTR
jgi:hypothetical protein